MLYCFYFSDTEAFEACFRLLHDDDDDDDDDDEHKSGRGMLLMTVAIHTARRVSSKIAKE